MAESSCIHRQRTTAAACIDSQSLVLGSNGKRGNYPTDLHQYAALESLAFEESNWTGPPGMRLRRYSVSRHILRCSMTVV
jgi:hypothetical protein